MAVMVAGCADGPDTPADPRTKAESARVVPAVRNPLDANRFLSDPCALITEREAADLGVPFVEKDSLADRAACVWREDRDDPTPLETLRVQILKDYGLAKISAECRTGCETWGVTEIDGYPALHANGPLESRYGMCRLYVGIADTRTVMITDGDLDAAPSGASEAPASGPDCDRSDRTAKLVIARLKAA